MVIDQSVSCFWWNGHYFHMVGSVNLFVYCLIKIHIFTRFVKFTPNFFGSICFSHKLEIMYKTCRCIKRFSKDSSFKIISFVGGYEI